jgi:hypothetical protein
MTGDEDDELTEIELAIKRGHIGILALSRELAFEQLDIHRPDGCPNYEDCLKFACIMNWKSWSCLLCDGEHSGVPGDIHAKGYGEIYGELGDDMDDSEGF